jgi:alkyl hydroperoxide reductase subunit F
MLDDSTIKASSPPTFERITQPIELIASLDDRPGAAEMRELMTEVAALSDGQDHGTLRRHDERRPSFQITRVGPTWACASPPCPWATNSPRWCWRCCRPAATRPRSSPRSWSRSRPWTATSSFETYMSLTCHNCPDVVQALNLMAVLNPRVRHVAIDGGLFQEEVEARQIMAVPTVY